MAELKSHTLVVEHQNNRSFDLLTLGNNGALFPPNLTLKTALHNGVRTTTASCDSAEMRTKLSLGVFK